MMRLFLLFMVTLMIASCAPTRYPPGHPKASASQQPQALHLAEGGVVKRGKPYQIGGKWYYPLASGQSYDETGIASWYGKKFHGKKTANGETYNMYAMTAAHTVLPIPSVVRVTNLENGKSIKVRINDRGPFTKKRVIDLSYAAAKALGVIKHGTAKVRVQTVLTPHPSILQQKNVGQPYVQIGAFGDKSNAQSVVFDMSNQSSFQPYIQKAAGVYRVRMGPFSSVRQAKNTLNRVKRMGYPSAMIIHD
ncbi:MAG: septal ring lytic transglycosylase RlpA family protein [Ghiorsea sp.]|nr:septal ring lytic transglycosylase RlpA family protein [Ghiorsea sp.]